MRKQQLIPIVIIGFIALAIVAIRAAGAIWPFRIISDQVSNPAGVAINGLRNNLADKYKFFSSPAITTKLKFKMTLKITRKAKP